MAINVNALPNKLEKSYARNELTPQLGPNSLHKRMIGTTVYSLILKQKLI